MPDNLQPYVTALFTGLGIGGVYALVALGYSLVYQSSGVFNLAQGELVTFGGLMAATLIVADQWPTLLALVAVIAFVALIGLFQERLTVAPLVRRSSESLAWVVTTLGASMVLVNVAQMTWGTRVRHVPPLVGWGPIRVLGAPIPVGYIMILVTALVVTVGLEIWLRTSITGSAWRATAEDAEAAQVQGIDVRRVGLMSFVLAAAISGLAGFVTVPVTAASFSTGALLSLKGFIALAIGGFGALRGALVGGLLLGVVEAEAVLLTDPGYRNVVALALLLAVLLVFPNGIVGRRRERVI